MSGRPGWEDEGYKIQGRELWVRESANVETLVGTPREWFLHLREEAARPRGYFWDPPARWAWGSLSPPVVVRDRLRRENADALASLGRYPTMEDVALAAGAQYGCDESYTQRGEVAEEEEEKEEGLDNLQEEKE